MTEAEWLVSTDPQAMLLGLRNKVSTDDFFDPDQRVSDRKLRLWACAACRQALSWSKNLVGDSLRLCDLSDRYADGEITYSELKAFRPTHPDCSWPLRYNKNVYVTVLNIINAKPFLGPQAALLRDIFNPFRPVTVNPAWLTWNDGIVVKLAQAAYDERTKPCPYCQDADFSTSDLGTPMMGGQEPYASRAARYFRSKCVCKGTRQVPNDDGTLDAGRLGVIADALEEAGCEGETIPCPTNCVKIGGTYRVADGSICPNCHGSSGATFPPHPLVAHLRSPGPHVPGCHAIDLLLGKS